MKFTVIIPAFNEEAYLASTLDSLQSAAAYLRVRSNVEANFIVVDNNSDDGTAAVARDRGATVVHEPTQGVARARNTGRASRGRGRTCRRGRGRHRAAAVARRNSRDYE